MRFRCFFVILFLVSYYTPHLFSQANVRPPEAFGDQLIVGVVGNTPSVLNPFQIRTTTEGQLIRLIFGTGLIQRADRFGQTDNLVDRYIFPRNSDSQGIDWSYDLKRNIFFQNGIPLRNDDVKYTFDILKKMGGFVLSRDLDYSNISSIGTSGDLEVTFLLKQKDNFFAEKLSDIPILSRRYYADVESQGYQAFAQIRPMGYGPFRLERFEENQIVLGAHRNYVFGSPFLNHIVYKFFPDEQRMLDSFIKDELDLIEIQDLITANRLSTILENKIRIFQAIRPEKKIYFLLFNVNSFPFNDSKVRLALKWAINQSEIVERLVSKNGHIAYSLIDYTNSLFYKELFRENYNPIQSLELLQKNGWELNKTKGLLEKSGKELQFDLIFEENSHLEESIARTIKIHLGELGINVVPKPVSLNNKEALFHENQFDAILLSYSYYDQDLYEVVKKFYYSILKNENNQVNYYNPTLENIFKRVNANRDLQNQIIQRFQIFLHQDSPAVFLYFDDKILYAVKNRFQNFRSPFSSDKIYYYRLAPFENWFVPKALQKYN